jgi:hypothetical protein
MAADSRPSADLCTKARSMGIERLHVHGSIPSRAHDLRQPLGISKRKLTAAYHVCASSGMLPAPDEIGLMSISR